MEAVANKRYGNIQERTFLPPNMGNPRLQSNNRRGLPRPCPPSRAADRRTNMQSCAQRAVRSNARARATLPTPPPRPRVWKRVPRERDIHAALSARPQRVAADTRRGQFTPPSNSLSPRPPCCNTESPRVTWNAPSLAARQSAPPLACFTTQPRAHRTPRATAELGHAAAAAANGRTPRGRLYDAPPHLIYYLLASPLSFDAGSAREHPPLSRFFFFFVPRLVARRTHILPPAHSSARAR